MRRISHPIDALEPETVDWIRTFARHRRDWQIALVLRRLGYLDALREHARKLIIEGGRS